MINPDKTALIIGAGIAGSSLAYQLAKRNYQVTLLDENNQPIEKVNVKTDNNGTATNTNGFYTITIPANKEITIEFTHLSHKKVVSTFNLKNGEQFEFNPVMSTSIEQIATVIVSGDRRKEVEGIITLKSEVIRKILYPYVSPALSIKP